MTNEKANPKLTLEKAQDQFTIWRKTRKKRGSIPEKLWNVAISLAESYSVHQISKGLHLNHTALKDRVEAMRMMPSEEPTQPTFIELPPMASGEVSLELENKAGGKMKIHVKGHTDINLVFLTQTFWSQQP
jgi:hypothetical protein